MSVMIANNWLAISLGGDTPVILACVALAAAVLFFVFGAKPSPGDSAPHRSKLDQLLERRETIYENLRDLKFEYRAGKFGEKDYEESRLALETEAAVVLMEIEQATGSPSLTGRRTTGHSEKTAEKLAQ
jgi:hypothetical protein